VNNVKKGWKVSALDLSGNPPSFLDMLDIIEDVLIKCLSIG
jgi:hypothetical protein